MKRNTPLVVGNWKMNPPTFVEARKIFVDIKKRVQKSTSTVVIAPPFPYLYEIGKARSRTNIKLAAQNMHHEQQGAHTGEVSPKMLRDTGADYVIIGHSERRAAGETDELVRKKIDTAVKAKLIPIVCVGESKRDQHGNFFSFVEGQLRAVLADRSTATVKKIVIAYEPIWAIGTGKHATTEDVEEMRLFIQKIISTLYDRATAGKVTVLYGGSVNADNCTELWQSGISGFLVGGASLRPAEFAAIVNVTETQL